MATARQYIMQYAEDDKAPTPDFKEVGSRSEDLDVGMDGRLRDDEEISLETFRKMRKDPQIKACLLILKLPILQVDWSLHADTEEGAKLAKWVEARLYDMDDSIQYYLREMLTAVDFGRSITEKIWQLKTVPMDEDGGRMSPSIVPKKLRTYDPRSLTFKLDPATYKLDGVLQKRKGGPEIMIPADKLLIYTHEKEFGDYNGEAALRAAYKPWVIKEFLQKFWNIALERFGTPFMAMQLPQGASLKSALQLMDGIKHKVGIPLPEGWKLDLHALANTGMSFKEAIEYQDTQIARAMLIPDLVFGNSNSGAYALSKTHAAMFLLRLNAISQELGDVLSSYLIKPLIRYNWGEVAEFPVFKFADVAEEDTKALAEVLNYMLTGKVIAPTEAWIRERLGFPAPDQETEDWLKKKRDEAPAVPGVPGDPEDDEEDDEPDPDVTDPEADKNKQDKIQKNAEDVDDYILELRSGIRGILKLGIGAGDGS